MALDQLMMIKYILNEHQYKNSSTRRPHPHPHPHHSVVLGGVDVFLNNIHLILSILNPFVIPLWVRNISLYQ